MERASQRRVAVVTDSTADLPKHLVERYEIQVVPQTLIMGDQTWRDGVDIDPATFYQLLRTSPHFPHTSQPSVQAFQHLFERLSKEVEGIVAVLISSEMSGTLNSAITAVASFPEVPIQIIDSRSVSMQLGYIVLAAARAANAGGDLETVADAARALVNRVHAFFVVDTLEYLHRNGRIGRAVLLFGSALNLKPVLAIEDGVITPVAKIRTRRKALEKVFELVDEQVDRSRRIHMAVLHVASPEEAAIVTQQLTERFHPFEMIPAECGPVVGAHAGPGLLGVGWYVE